MVFYFDSKYQGSTIIIYVGKDKHENEELIKHGLDSDVWFHVDKLSSYHRFHINDSAHVYLRLPEDMTWDTIPEELLVDAAQLTKANSIEGRAGPNRRE
jgi:predicted ribosome quality control (RQC) complex YloA/Tae2 family protein